MTLHLATAAAGTEDLLADELRALGATAVRRRRGLVEFEGERELALKACLWLRTAMRVLVPLGEVAADDATALYEGVRGLSWQEHLDERHTLAVEVAGRAEGIAHTHYAALRIKDAVVDQLREKRGARPDVNAKDPDVRIVAHLSQRRCLLSLDLSGEPLFKRGYRVATTPAPLKETLAAAVVLASGWKADRPLADPMCGSGTIAIEAALLAQNRAPNASRAFGVERWPSFGERERRLLSDLRAEARASVRRGAPPVFASDRDEQAVAATQANVRKAGVPVTVSRQDARELRPLSPPGFIVVNPPYGERLEAGGRKQLKTFFWQLGQSWRGFEGHDLAVLAGGPEFESAFGLRPSGRQPLYNGPIRCTLLRYRLGAAGEARGAPEGAGRRERPGRGARRGERP